MVMSRRLQAVWLGKEGGGRGVVERGRGGASSITEREEDKREKARGSETKERVR
jgi:hypothetical protein